MDVKLTSEQVSLQQSVRAELERHRRSQPSPGPSQADLGALTVLAAGGYLDVLADGGTPVDAALIIETAAAYAPGAPVASRALIAPFVTDRDFPNVIATLERPSGALAKFAAQAEAFLVLDGRQASWVEAADAVVTTVPSRWGYPIGRVSISGGEDLGPDSGIRLLNAWRAAIAAEAGGLMSAATRHATAHVAVRAQFGRPIGSLQSIQHRLAHAHVLAQGAIWLGRRSAWNLEDHEAAAAAACHADVGMREVAAACQQVCGAVSLTDEFGLTAYTARMTMLLTELGGVAGHARALAEARWPGLAR